MRITPFHIRLGAILVCTGVVTAHAAEGVFYDPSNAASPTGNTIGYKLFRTIGCPGRELLARPCPREPAQAVPLAAVPEPAPAPAAVASADVAPVAAVVSPPAPAPADVVPEPAPAPPKLVLEGVNFDFDKANLRMADILVIDGNAAELDQLGNVNIEVAGHTDSIGSVEYNLNLAQRRADTVRNYLMSKGIAADRLSTKAYGESQPVADNATAEGRFENRRVELLPLKRAEQLNSMN